MEGEAGCGPKAGFMPSLVPRLHSLQNKSALLRGSPSAPRSN